MKTKNNVQKAIKKSLAVIISLVLISITVNAQDFWKTVLENNSFSLIALAMTNDTEASQAKTDAYTTSETDAYAEYFVVETEEAMDIEPWMLEENNFFTTVSLETEVENKLEIESWMTDETVFDVYAAYYKIEAEEALEVENWMLNKNYFGVQTVEIKTEIEETMEVEAWMTDSRTWEM
jgi:hypothetical protein